MKKIIQKILTVYIVAFICFTLCSVVVFAEPSVEIGLNVKSPKVNEKVTVTVKISGESHEGAAFNLTYDPNILTYTGAEEYANGGGGSVHVEDTYAASSSHSFSLTFTARKAGSCNLEFLDGRYVPENAIKEYSLSNKSRSLTVSDASKSANANLSSLKISSGTLSPRFSASTTKYTVTVPKSTENFYITATPADSDAKINQAGTSKLKIGENTFEIMVTAASGAQKKYTVVVTRTEEEEPVGEDDPYEAQIGDTKYTLATDLTGVLLPNGFTPSTADYLGKEVAVATDKNNTFTLYYLQQKDAEGAKFVPYLLKSDQFIKVPCVTFGNNTYIITEFPDGVVPPSDTYETTLSIGGNSVIAYRKENGDPDFYYLYCFYNDSFGVYRYDQKEDVLQRNPEFLLTESLEPVAEDTAETAAPKPFTERFSALSIGAKIILILLLLAALIFATLLVFAYLTLMRSRKEKMGAIEENMAFGDQPDDFDQVQVESDDTPHTEEVSPDEEE